MESLASENRAGRDRSPGDRSSLPGWKTGWKSALHPAIQPGDAEAIWGPRDFEESRLAQDVQHLLGRREAVNGGGQIGIRTGDPRERRSNSRQNVAKVERIE